jgi:hypothetical protein
VPDRLCYAFAYHPSQWSIVFPLGMYGTATLALSRLTGFAALAFLGRGFVWSAFGAWLALALLAAAAEVGGGPAGMGAPEVSRRAAQAVSPAGSPRLGHDSLPLPRLPRPQAPTGRRLPGQVGVPLPPVGRAKLAAPQGV